MNLSHNQFRRYTLMVTGALLLLQILWPPKEWTMTSPFGSKHESLGRHFIFKDPMAEGNRFVSQTAASGFDMGARSSTSIAWGSHLLAIVLTAAAGATMVTFGPDLFRKR